METSLNQPNETPSEFVIVIKAKQNTALLHVEPGEKGQMPTYHQVIGVLEIVKSSLVMQESGFSMKEFMEWAKQNCKDPEGNTIRDLA